MANVTEPERQAGDWLRATDDAFVAAEGLRWHVRRFGAGPLLLLIHGTGASGHSWAGLIDELAGGFTLLVIDLPGHGLTEPLPTAAMSLDQLAARVGGLLSAIGSVPDGIVGHSAGAAIAIRAALDRRIPAPKMIVSVNGALLPFGGVAGWLFPPMARVLATGTIASRLLAHRAAQPETVARMLAGTGAAPPAWSLACYEALLRQPGHVKAALDMMAMWNLESLKRDLPRLTVPLELIACGGDAAVPPESAFTVRDIASGAHVSYVRNLGHLAHEESPAIIADLVQAAWRRCQGATRDAGSAPETGRERAV